MSTPAKIGGGSPNWVDNRMHVPANSGPTSTAATVGTTGTLPGGHTVQQLATPQAPGQRSGIGHRIANFFTTSLPNFFKDAASAILKKCFGGSSASAPTAQPPATAQTPATTASSTPSVPPPTLPSSPKPAELLKFPGDYYGSDDEQYTQPTHDDGMAAIYATVQHFTSEVNDSNSGAFMRGSDFATNKLAKFEGKAMMTAASSRAETVCQGKGMLAISQIEYTKKGMDVQGDEAKRIAKTTVDAVQSFFSGIFGDPDDDDSISKAALRVPPGLCNAVAVACTAIDTSTASPAVKDDLKKKMLSDMILLRVVNPAIIDVAASKTTTGAALTDIDKKSSMELSKFCQKLGNNMPVADGDTPVCAPEVKTLLKKDDVEGKLRKGFESFCEAVLKRADKGVVAMAVMGGVQMKIDFDEARKAA